MVRCVVMPRFPAGLKFPAELQERIRYDADKQQLQFEGYMSKTDFDTLNRLHNDLEYQRALEHLFQICVFESDDERRPSRKMAYLGVAATGALVVVCIVSLFLLLR